MLVASNKVHIFSYVWIVFAFYHRRSAYMLYTEILSTDGLNLHHFCINLVPSAAPWRSAVLGKLQRGSSVVHVRQLQRDRREAGLLSSQEPC